MNTATIPTDRRPIGFWLKLVDRLIDAGFDDLLGERGLTRRHWQVLNVLEQGGSTLQEVDERVAPFLGDDEPSTRPVLESLRDRGWGALTDAGTFVLTAEGAAARADLLETVAANRRRVATGITPDEYQATVDVLRRMAVNLGWAEAGT